MCKTISNLCDAKMSAIVQSTEKAKEEIENELGSPKKSAEMEFVKYKYVIVVDGNSAPSSRLALQLFSNSLILLQETPWFEGYYNGLRPYVHYVPVSRHFEDLEEKIKWAQTHEDQVLKIIRNANKFARYHLNYKKVLQEFGDLLVMYSKLLNFPVESKLAAGFVEVPLHCKEEN